MHRLSALIAFAVMSGPSAQTQTIREAPQPATPQPIRVGDALQAAPTRLLGARWAAGLGSLLTHEQLEADERTAAKDPDDVCSRGRLIAFRRYPEDRDQQAGRIDHLVEMIRRHPEWDGFSLDPFNGVEEPRSPQERERYQTLKESWLAQVGPEQRRSIVLHNAAMFFAIREPELAAGLLKRAVTLEPSEGLYVERLGIVYALAQMKTVALIPYGVVNAPDHPEFAARARVILLTSSNWILARGAASALGGCGCDLSKELSARADSLSSERRLPSWSERFRNMQCTGR